MRKFVQISAIVCTPLLVLFKAAPTSGQVSPTVHPSYYVKAASKTAVLGFTPAQIKRAYGFDELENQGEGQVIAIIDAFDDPNIEQDLKVFSRQFGLPSCSTANKCFEKVMLTPQASTSLDVREVWALETALDVEWAHAVAPKAKILLVEAKSDLLTDMLDSVDEAVEHHASVVSMSWGGWEFPTESSFDRHFLHPNVTFFASAGDFGHGVMYPAASPQVIGVGGTTLYLDAHGNYKTETAWSDAGDGYSTGGGLSPYENEPIYQVAFHLPNDTGQKRGTPDVAYVADPNSGVAMYDSFGYFGFAGWFETGGTSVGPPQWAALVAIANSLRNSDQKPSLTGSLGFLYDAARSQKENFHDILTGSNGTCGTLCNAVGGYDYLTGLGSPQADHLVGDLSNLEADFR
jgi:subtilase family serine protease